MPIVNIVVPVYKVEPYIHQCVDSILNQTFTDFELILVDDGSPDNCGIICDEYAKKDKRVHVIHQKNGGLSAARNAGIDWATESSHSNFLLFVDPDDLIKLDLLERVIKAQEETNADIVCFGIEMVNEQLTLLDWGHTKNSVEEFFDKSNRFAPLLPPYTTGDYAVNKLYKKHLFTNIRYPINLTFEDIYTTYKVFDLAASIVLIPDRLYIYRRRQGSITRKQKFNSSSFNMFFSAKEKCFYIKERSPELSKNASTIVFNSISILLTSLFANKEYSNGIINQMRQIVINEQNDLIDNPFCDKYTTDLCRALAKGLPYAKTYYRNSIRRRKIINNYYSMLESLISLKHRIFKDKK